MYNSDKGRTLIASAVLSLAVAVPALAQSYSAPASTPLRTAAQSLKAAGCDTRAATKDTYYAAKAVLRDAEINSKAQATLHNDPTTHHYNPDCHNSRAKVATPERRSPSDDIVRRTKQLAMILMVYDKFAIR
jgi:hypothetical protein